MIDWIETILTMTAIISSPLIAFWVSKTSEKRRIKCNLFQVLMQTRMIRNCDKHIATLNLVEIEFWDNQEVIEAWNEYIETCNKKGNSMSLTREKIDRDKKIEDLHIELLFQISQSLGYDVEKSDIENANFLNLRNR